MTYKIIDKINGIIYEYSNLDKFEKELSLLTEINTEKGKSICLKWKKYPYVIDLCLA